ncbi:NK-tumor recognition protein-like isoform X2 [Zophobas morio]|uniref:NK-tumor recognition protein-like isoform X2 n=1 Tax=Zophobas morio TaxID=2755281 RepID=UPI00308295A8
MHKQFQKFGHFVLKNLNEEPDTTKDKYVKYIYKKESGSSDKAQKRKIKSANDADTNSRYSKKRDEKRRSHRNKSSESLRTHRTKEPQGNYSQTEIFFISPEELKQHRKKSVRKTEESQVKNKHKSSNRDRDHERRSTRKSDDYFEQFLKQQKQNKHRDECQWLTRKEIFKLINSEREPTKSPGSNFFKKFFVFDKHSHDKAEFIPLNEKYYKDHRYSEDNTNMIFVPLKPTVKEVVKPVKKRDKEQLVEVRDSKKHNKERTVDKSYPDQAIGSSHKRKSPPSVHNKLVFEDLDTFQKKEKKASQKNPDKQSVQTIQPKESRNSKSSANKLQEKPVASQEVKLPSQSKTKSKWWIADVDENNVFRLDKTEETKMQNVSRANPLRHKFCLVKNTFSVVAISPVQVSDNSVEKKKNLKTFKKYYKYNRGVDKDSDFTNSTTFQTFSDSHKLYQDMSEQSVEEAPKKRKKSRRKSSQDQKLKLETNVSSVVIKPEPCRILAKSKETNKEEKKVGRSKQKSKIPVLNSHAKILELPREPSPVAKSRKKSADLFNPKVTHEEVKTVPTLEDNKNRRSKTQKQKVSTPKPHEDKLEKTEVGVKTRSLPSSKSNSARSSVVEDRYNSTKSTKLQTISSGTQQDNPEKKSRPSAIPKVDKKESRMSKASTVSRQSKASNFDNKSTRSTTASNASRKRYLPSSAPVMYPKESTASGQKGFKSASKSSNDTWSRVSSKKSIKSPEASKSDTKLQANKKVGKNFEPSSAKTSLSNSTCGDKSVASSKNETSFFLTKSYKDDDKLSRWHKRKQYADNLRKNALSKNQKTPVIPPQVLEVRYLTVSNPDIDKVTLSPKEPKEVVPPIDCSQDTRSNSSVLSQPEIVKEFYDDDLPQPYLEVVDSEKFNELFTLPVEQALNEILNENNNFLKKDFSFSVDVKCCSSDDVSTDDVLSDRKLHDWYNLQMTNQESLSEISSFEKNSDKVDSRDLLGSQDHIIDSLSAPGSEESGYATIKSRKVSSNFFERPDIKALFEPPVDVCSVDYCVEVRIETKSASQCGLEIHSIENQDV